MLKSPNCIDGCKLVANCVNNTSTTIIPSSKKWVFHAIFHLAFLQLYGTGICSMNPLVLTDEEDAEYGSFEALIATNDIFKSSKVMLCIYHALWQPFKRDIHPLLPRKSAKGKPIELTTVGSQWGNLLFSLLLSKKCKMTFYLM